MKVVENKQTILIIRFDRYFLDLLRTINLKDYYSGKLDAYVEIMHLQNIINKEAVSYTHLTLPTT